MPTWAGTQTDAFLAGFGIVEITAATLFAFLIVFVTLKRLLQTAGVL